MVGHDTCRVQCGWTEQYAGKYAIQSVENGRLTTRIAGIKQVSSKSDRSAVSSASARLFGNVASTILCGGNIISTRRRLRIPLYEHNIQDPRHGHETTQSSSLAKSPGLKVVVLTPWSLPYRYPFAVNLNQARIVAGWAIG